MWFCKHDWKVLESTYDKSPLERLVENGMINIKRAEHSALFGTRIIVCSCNNCGKLKTITEKV